MLASEVEKMFTAGLDLTETLHRDGGDVGRTALVLREVSLLPATERCLHARSHPLWSNAETRSAIRLCGPYNSPVAHTALAFLC